MTVSSDILISVLAAGGLVASVVCLWRFTAVVVRMSEYSARFAERNDAQRDRFYTVMLEKMQVNGDQSAAVRMAQMHASETQHTYKEQLRRDQAADKAKEGFVREAKAIKSLREREQPHPTLTEQDGMV